jgi:hypothetical protein
MPGANVGEHYADPRALQRRYRGNDFKRQTAESATGVTGDGAQLLNAAEDRQGKRRGGADIRMRYGEEKSL